MESDLACLRRYATSRDADAFAELVQQYGGMVFSIARRITRDAHAAEDVTQRCFLELARNAGRIRSSVVAWLHQTATHRSLDTLRERRRAIRREQEVARDSAASAVAEEWRELLPLIDAAIDSLPDDLREPLVLHYLDSRPQADVAAALNVDQSTVSRRLTKAVEQLRQALKSQGIEAPAVLPLLLDHAGPVQLPATLAQSLTKIGLSGAGPTKPAAVGMHLAIAAVLCVLIGLLISRLAAPRPLQKLAAAATQPTAAPAERPMPPAPPTTRPTALQLLEEVEQSQAWIGRAKSFSLEAVRQSVNSPQVIAARTAALKRQFPTATLSPDKFPEISPNPASSILSIDFDAQHVRVREESLGSTRTAIWDGGKQFTRTIWRASQQDDLSWSPNIGESLARPFSYTVWPNVTRPTFWWTPPPDEDTRISLQWRARTRSLWPEAKLDGPVMYRGKWCWVVLLREQWMPRWYIGVDDHRLYGYTTGVMNREDPNVVDAFIRAAAGRGAKVSNVKEFWKWEDKYEATLPRDGLGFERILGDVGFHIGLGPIVPTGESWMSDYREITPGRWLPFKQGFLFNRTDDHGRLEYVDTHIETTLRRVTVDEPIPAERFAPDFAGAVGANMYDSTFSPPLIYKWKPEFTEDEWKNITDEAEKRQQEMLARENAMNRLLHKPAPPLPAEGWVNGVPLTWETLRGKVVILSFWAEWCGPCENELPTLADLHATSAETGIHIIGLHTSGTRAERVKKKMDLFKIQYPVCIDRKDSARSGFGQTMNAFGVIAVPHTFVIDAKGIVAGHGNLESMLTLARSLVPPTTQPSP